MQSFVDRSTNWSLLKIAKLKAVVNFSDIYLGIDVRIPGGGGGGGGMEGLKWQVMLSEQLKSPF